MGLFGNKNKYDICPKIENLNSLVTNYSKTRGTVKVNAKLIVPEGYWFVLGRSGKVTDKFDAGEYFLNFANMPYMCRKFKIDKIENGKQKERFNAEQYFISQDLRAGKFKTYRKVEMGTKAYGIFKAEVFGLYSYRVIEPKEFMQSLLNEFDFIKTGEDQEIIEAWVNDIVVEVLEKNNFMINDVVENNPIIANKIKDAVSKLFKVAGLELCNLRIYKYKLPRKYQQASDNAIKLQEEKLKNQIEQETQDINIQNMCDTNINENVNDDSQIVESESLPEEQIINEKITPSEDIAQEEQKLNNNAILQTEVSDNVLKNEQAETFNKEDKKELPSESNNYNYVPFGNFKIEESNQVELKQNKNNDNKGKETTFVDLNVDRLYYGNMSQSKRCLNCGEINNIHATHCLLCGKKFD